MASRLAVLARERADLMAEAAALEAALNTENRDPTDTERARVDAINARQAVIAADTARLTAIREWERETPAEPAATPARVTDVRDLALSKPWGHDFGATALYERAKTVHTHELRAKIERQATEIAAGEYLQSIYRAYTDQGFDARLTHVNPTAENRAERSVRFGAAAQGMGRLVGPDGGFLVGTTFADDIKLRMTAGEIFRRISPIPLDAGTDNIEINLIDETSRATGSRSGAVQGYWLDEGTAPTASRPKLRKYQLRTRGLAALGYATNDLLNNAAALGNLMLTAFAEELKFLVEDAIVEGSGTGKPQGILVNGSLISITKETGQAAATIVNENLSKVWARFDDSAKLSPNACWLINTDVNPQLDQLALGVGLSALEPRFVNYDATGVVRIKGKPVVPVEYCSTLGTVGDIILWNPDRYGFIERTMEQASSMHVAFTTNEMAFRVTYYVDGAMKDAAPLTPFKGSNTLSHALAVATRA